MNKTNKLISILLVLAMMLTMAPLSLTASAASGTCGENAKWSLNKGVLTISGSGDMTDYESYEDLPWYGEIKNIKKVVVESGITRIGKYSFYDHRGLQTVEIKGKPTIYDYAFAYCNNLTDVVYGGTVDKICFQAFQGCSSNFTLTMPECLGKSKNSFSVASNMKVKLVDANGNDKTDLYYITLITQTSNQNYLTIQANLEKGSISAISDQIYTGSAVTPAVTVKWNGKTVSSNNYNLVYSNNIEEGTATVTVKGKDDYARTLTQTFKIFVCKHEGQVGICGVCGENLHNHAYNYTANGNVITATCSNSDGACLNTNGGTLTISAPAELYTDGTISREATVENNLVDTSVEVSDIAYSTADGSAPKTAGTYTASVTVGGATASVEYTLVKKNAAADMFVFSAPANLVYDGTAKYATVEVSPEITGMGAVTVAYYKNGVAVDPVNAGTYTVKVSTAESDKYYALTDVELGSFTIGKKAVTVSATVPDRIYGDDYQVDTSKVVVTFDGVVDGDNVGYVVIDAYYHMHTVTDSAPVQVVYNVNGADAGNYQFPEYGDWMAPNYGVQATGKVLPRDIADAQIVLGDALTYNGTEQTQSIAGITIIGKDVTYTVSGNTATNVGVYELTITANTNFTGTKTVLYAINPDLSDIEGLDQYNVKSTNKADIEYVYNQLDNAETDLASAEKKAEWNEIKDECWQWLKILESVAYKVESLGNSHLAYDIDTVTSADDEALEALEAEMYLFMRDYRDNMTEEELLKVDNARIEISYLRDRIAKTKSEYDRVIAAANGYDEVTVTSADKVALVKLNEDIYALALTENVTAEEKANLQAAHDKVFALIDKLVGISDEIKRITEKVDAYIFESVKSSDKADIQQLIADIKALLDTQNLTADERTILETADETCDKLVAKIDETVAETKRINDATNVYDESTVTSVDKEAVEQLIADIKALTDGDNITGSEREQLVADDETLDALLTKINATAGEIARIEETVNGYDEATVKSTDKADLEQLKEDIQALIDSTNITENEKTALAEMLGKVDTLLNKISETEEKLEEIKGIENNFNPETVSSDDKQAIEEKIAEIENVNSDNLTEEQKAEYGEIKAGFEALLDKISSAILQVDAVGEVLEALDADRATIFWEEDIEAVKAKIDELLADENMGETEKARLNEYKAQCNEIIGIINTPAKYFSMRFFYLVWDAINWLVNRIAFIF